MPAKKRSFSLLFFLWPASLLAAFFIGRLSLSNDPSATYQASLLESSDKTESKSLTDIRYDTPPQKNQPLRLKASLIHSSKSGVPSQNRIR